MNLDAVTELCRAALSVTLLVAAPALVVAVAVGLLVSVAQAVTQIQDQTVALIPKIVLMLLTLLYVLPWGLTQLVEYSTGVFEAIPGSLP